MVVTSPVSVTPSISVVYGVGLCIGSCVCGVWEWSARYVVAVDGQSVFVFPGSEHTCHQVPRQEGRSPNLACVKEGSYPEHSFGTGTTLLLPFSLTQGLLAYLNGEVGECARTYMYLSLTLVIIVLLPCRFFCKY